MAKMIARCFSLIMFILIFCQAGAQENTDVIKMLAVHEKFHPVVSVERRDAYFNIYAMVLLPVPPCQAYALLTDYASLPGYIPGMLKVSFERLSDSMVKIRQVGEAKLLLFSVKVELLLEMEEIPNQRILFKLIEGDLEAYSGEWRLQEVSEGTKLFYSAALIFDQYVPTFWGRSMLEDEVSKRFEAVVKEAKARKSRVYPQCVVKR